MSAVAADNTVHDVTTQSLTYGAAFVFVELPSSNAGLCGKRESSDGEGYEIYLTSAGILTAVWDDGSEETHEVDISDFEGMGLVAVAWYDTTNTQSNLFVWVNGRIESDTEGTPALGSLTNTAVYTVGATENTGDDDGIWQVFGDFVWIGTPAESVVESVVLRLGDWIWGPN